MNMSPRKRMLTAIERKKPDRLPVTTHHLMRYYLNKNMNGMSHREFFDYFGFDAIRWITNYKPDESKGDYFDPNQEIPGFLESRRIFNDCWRIETEPIPNQEYTTKRYRFITPKGTLSMVLQSNEYTEWVCERLIKEKKDIDIINEFMTIPKCDVEAANKAVNDFGERGIVRSHICTFDVFGQPGCWQDACCLVGTEKIIMETFDDPQWVHSLLEILQKRKIGFLHSMQGARYDILELGGGDASTTVISPKIFNEFVAPYDKEVIRTAHEAGQRITYHTCGGMMPILEDIAAMEPDAMETFTPPEMGADVDLAEAKRRIGNEVCIIGGFNQLHYLKDCRPDDTRAAVRRCFDQAGENGGYIISPSDHFFEAETELIRAFVDEATRCTY